MPTALRQHRYGKSGIRLVKVTRDGDRHDLVDLTIDIALEGDFRDSYVDGDNAAVLPTDTMRGTAYALARQAPIDAIESFGIRLAKHFVDTVHAVSRARVRLAEQPWDRAVVGGLGHDHTFLHAGGGRRTALVTLSAEEAHIVAGLEDLVLLKTSRSAFRGFVQDRYTTLRETDDRVLATAATIGWRYTQDDLEWRPCANDVRRQLVETFAGHDSQSVQHTLYAMGEAVLGARSDVAEVRLSMSNLHHIAVDLSPYGLDNPDEVFVATDRPYGLIEATVLREGAQPTPEAW